MIYGKPNIERWCGHCENLFELTADQVENACILCPGCEEESRDATDLPDPEFVVYEKENPR